MKDGSQSPADTSAATEALIWKRLELMSPEEKFQRFFRLNHDMRALTIAGISARYPQAGPEELRLRFAAQTLGRELSVKFLNWDPEIKGY